MCIAISFFNDTATTEIYTLSLHDALPISAASLAARIDDAKPSLMITADGGSRMGKPVLYKSLVDESLKLAKHAPARRSEEHTSELRSRQYLVCRLLLEKKKLKPCSHP